ncbi:MAG: hypothetical protein GXZ09_00630 [Syntrophomonadaceae bacterium]|jgi:hypothetical protein|nr:hypothetical protein [Syntrophomonadaceae bacterium]
MAFFLKLLVFSVWVVIMAALIIGSIQGGRRCKRGRRYEKIKPAAEKENGRFFSCQLIWICQENPSS